MIGQRRGFRPRADESMIEYVRDRPGHDLRYALDTSKIRSMGWNPMGDFDEGLGETVAWYRENEGWWRRVREGAEYTAYYEKQYDRE